MLCGAHNWLSQFIMAWFCSSQFNQALYLC